jgi:hypothetical protein
MAFLCASLFVPNLCPTKERRQEKKEDFPTTCEKLSHKEKNAKQRHLPRKNKTKIFP